MGKKSKKGAVANPKPTGGKAADGGNRHCTDGGILTSVADNGKLRCAHCCALLKELAKSHQCPGCSLFYCWRCEKKYFEECPNKAGCVRQVRRCVYCWNASTMKKFCGKDLLIKKGDSQERAQHSYITTKALKLFDKRIGRDEALSIDAFPFVFCPTEGCKVMECHVCCLGPATSRLMSCISCHKSRCHICNNSNLKEFVVPPDYLNTINSLLISGRDKLTQEELTVIGNALRADWSDLYVICSCGEAQCYSCLDDRVVDFLCREMIMTEMGIDLPPTWSDRSSYECSRCYWKSKPCTNPNCPNEIGIETNRCGGCHLDRYCSVECQAAMYPEHVGKCHKIQEKRAAVAGEAEKEES